MIYSPKSVRDVVTMFFQMLWFSLTSPAPKVVHSVEPIARCPICGKTV